jgi:hypothetical protein
MKYIINIQVHFVGYLYFMDLINAQEDGMYSLLLTTMKSSYACKSSDVFH